MLYLVKGVIMKKLKNKRGSATTEMVMIIAILVVILVTIFYPQLSNLINFSMNSIGVWFNNSLSKIGMV